MTTNASMKMLIGSVEQRTEGALATWQSMRQECQQALDKLEVLKRHRERYSELLRGGLQNGMSGFATSAYLGFIKKIDDVVLTQQGEVIRIEAACARQWEQVVALRREKRTYELLGERSETRELQTALRRSQREIDDVLQRAASLPALFN
ncbi:MAG: flagellar export protein FliJ [Alphaproteobacteria bacterium]|nr:flagellar export protein FliJ [Alphaproteobacteria bacterium]